MQLTPSSVVKKPHRIRCQVVLRKRVIEIAAIQTVLVHVGGLCIFSLRPVASTFS